MPLRQAGHASNAEFFVGNGYQEETLIDVILDISV